MSATSGFVYFVVLLGVIALNGFNLLNLLDGVAERLDRIEQRLKKLEERKP